MESRLAPPFVDHACLNDNLVQAYVEDAVLPDERAAVDHHLASCRSCRELLVGIRRVMSSTVGSQAETPTQDAFAATRRSDLADPAAVPRDLTHLPLVSPSLYERQAQIGRGGLGLIIRARDTRTGRIVAIKEMRVESIDAELRFAREALVTARLQHPAIVPVYEVGQWPNGQPFYAMKLVTGRPLSDVIRDADDLDERLGLVPHVIAVADALAYAHGERVIHRDLKPSNIMVGAHGDTVVIDWGLARWLDGDAESLPPLVGVDPGQTVVGAVLGTPAYMAPEQARGERVDERADVYAIGAILHHVLCGRPPYADGEPARDPVELIRRVRSSPPRHIAAIVPGAPPDLVAIVDRAMARGREARYPTAAALADDLRRFATGQLVLAHRYTRGQRMRRFIRRHRAALAVASLALVALVALAAISVERVVAERDRLRAAQKAEATARKLAEDRGAEVTGQLTRSYLERAHRELADRQPARALALLAEAHRAGDASPRLRLFTEQAARAMPELIRWPDRQIDAGIRIGERDFAISTGDEVVRRSPDVERWRIPLAGVSSFVELDDERLIAVTPTGAVVLAARDGHELARLGTLAAPTEPDQPVEAHLAGRRWLALKAHAGAVEVWDITAGRRTARFSTDLESGYVAVSPDGRRVAVTGRGGARTAMLYSAVTGRPLAPLCSPDEDCARVSPAAGDVLVLARAIGDRSGLAVVYDWAGRPRYRIEARSPVMSVALAPTAGLVVALSYQGEVLATDLATGHRRWSASTPMQGFGIELDERSGRLWTSGRDGHIALLDLATGTERGWWWLSLADGAVLLAASGDGGTGIVVDHTRAMFAWSPGAPAATVLAPTPSRVMRALWLDERRIATGSEDGTITVRDTVADRELTRLRAHTASISTLQALPGDRLLSAGRDNAVIIWDLARGLATHRLDGAGLRAAASPDTTRVVAVRADGRVALHRLGDAAATDLGRLERSPMVARWSPDGRWIAVIDDGGGLGLWRAADGVLVRALPTKASGPGGVDVAFSPDSRWLLPARSGELELLALDGGSDRPLAGAGTDFRWAAAFALSGKRALTSDPAGVVRVWSVDTGQPIVQVANHASVIGAALDRDGDRLFTGSYDRSLRMRDATTGAELAVQAAPDAVYSLALSPGGDTIVATTLGPAILWRIPAGTVDPGRLPALARCGGYAVRDQVPVPSPPPPDCPQAAPASATTP
jgi:WD40 repeat protein